MVKKAAEQAQMRIGEAITYGTELLAASSDSAKLDAELLLCSATGQNRTWFFTWPEKHLTTEQQQNYQGLLVRRQAGEPVAYLTGEQGFWSLNLHTNNCTLIPRPDTECLVEFAIATDLPTHAKVLDLGTGTGAIALALACEKPQWQIHACDVNSDAVKLAQHNARLNGLDGVIIEQSDWFSAYEAAHLASFDLIVSNPPYIDKDDKHLQLGDVRFEPLGALVSEGQGLADIAYIARRAGRFLKPGGWLMVEHGFEQGALVRDIFCQHGFARVITKKDLSDNERFTVGSR